MVLIKETSIVLLVALVVYRSFFVSGINRKSIIETVRYSIPLFMIGGFFVLQKIATGKWFFIYDFEIQLFDFNATSVRQQFMLITRWIFVEQHRFVLTILIALDLILNPAARRRRELALFGLIVLLSGYSFSVLYFLPRYLLPVLPFFYILGAVSLMDLVRFERLRLPAGIAATAGMVWSLAVQPFWGNGEVNLTYLEVIKIHRSMIEQLSGEFPSARILTAWPYSTELSSPVLGYVRRPMNVTDFTGEDDLEKSDLVLTATPGLTERMDALRTLAQRTGWLPIKRLGQGRIETELYVPPTAGARRSE
jgi:hypothetical protein